MEQRPLGTTGLQLTRLGLGMAALGRPGYINLGHADDLGRSYDSAVMQQHAATVLAAAWQAGIRYFDAARSYGRGEEFLGQWLRAQGLAPTAVVVGSKWGYTYTASWQVHADRHEVKEHTLPVLERQWAESQANLGAYLQLYQIHSATLESGVLDKQEVLRKLAQLQASGVHIGLSLSGVGQAETLRKALAVQLEGRRLFACVQATWNLLEPSAEAALREAHAAGVGVIIKEALANGRLTERNRASSFTRPLQMLRATAQRHAMTVDALALAAVLAQPWVDVVLSGAATVAQLEANLQALHGVTGEEVRELLLHLAEAPADYWHKRSALAWN